MAAPAGPRITTVLQGDRAKAYRPIPSEGRRAALDRAMAAWLRDDWFEAHELLEPAWMGTADVVERDLYQGLIKLAAGYVHRTRGNPAGMTKNLVGARRRLASVAAARPDAEGFDVPALLAAIDTRLDPDAANAELGPPALTRRTQ